MARRHETWSPTDHACRECGGRVVMVHGHGPTGGGNPIWRCADCGIALADMGPECICWCGFSHKGQADTPYRCVRVDLGDKEPAIDLALGRSGYGTKSSRRRPKCEIAVIHQDAIDWARQKVGAFAEINRGEGDG
jgi:hypothetical protein